MIYFFSQKLEPKTDMVEYISDNEAEKIIKEDVLLNIYDLQNKNNKNS